MTKRKKSKQTETRTGSSAEDLSDLTRYILLPGRSHGDYSYSDLLVEKTLSHQGKNWYDCHKALHDEEHHMLTPRQFVDYLNHLKSGHAFDGRGKKIAQIELEQKFSEITHPVRGVSEWLDLYCVDLRLRFEVVGNPDIATDTLQLDIKYLVVDDNNVYDYDPHISGSCAGQISLSTKLVSTEKPSNLKGGLVDFILGWENKPVSLWFSNRDNSAHQNRLPVLATDHRVVDGKIRPNRVCPLNNARGILMENMAIDLTEYLVRATAEGLPPNGIKSGDVGYIAPLRYTSTAYAIGYCVEGFTIWGIPPERVSLGGVRRAREK